MQGQALAGIRVLDLGQRMSTAWCTRLLADFGAQVQYPADHPLLRQGPFDASGHSIPARYVLANKTARGAATAALLQEVGTFDVLVDDAMPGSAQAAELDDAQLAARQPRLLRVTITANGLTGARAVLAGNDLTAYAWSGWAAVNGIAGRPPLKGSGFQASYQAGTLAAAVLTSALLERLASALGQHIDIGEADVLAFTFAPALLRTAYTGQNMTQREDVDFATGPVPCKDGYFALTPSRERFWTEAMRVLGLPDLADDVQLPTVLALLAV